MTEDPILASPSEIASAMQIANPMKPGRHRTPLPAEDDPRISQRQREMIQLANSGLTNRQIATTTGLSGNTVALHLAKARKRTAQYECQRVPVKERS